MKRNAKAQRREDAKLSGFSFIASSRLRVFAFLISTIILGASIPPTMAQNDAGAPVQPSADHTPLPGTEPLTMTGDIASNLVAGVDRFLLSELDKSAERRSQYWHRDFSSAQAYQKSIEPNREQLKHILGVRDKRNPEVEMELDGSVGSGGLLFRNDQYTVYAVRWPAFGDVWGEGLLLSPSGARMPRSGNTSLFNSEGLYHPSIPVPGDVIAIPDADQTPEQLAGLSAGIAPESQFARRLAESGCRVLIPVLINRQMGEAKTPLSDRGKGLSNREFLYRSAFELGRHLIGYEVQKVLAGVDWFAKRNHGEKPIGVIGWGEGGMIALYAAALDSRITATSVSGYFDDRREIWQQPIDRNVFGLLEQFGDAEIAGMIAPHSLIIEAAKGPEISLAGNGGGAPAQLKTPPIDRVRAEFKRAQDIVAPLPSKSELQLIVSGTGSGPYGSEAALQQFLKALNPKSGLAPAAASNAPPPAKNAFDPKARWDRQFHEIDRHNQQLLIESPYVRSDFMKDLKTDSPEAYTSSSEKYRKTFYDDVIGRFDQPLLPAHVRSRRAYDSEKWTGYEVVMDVFPDVIAYGILLLPKDLKPTDKRPVVVCQHGLEGRPQDAIMGNSQYYHDFASRLADQGFITFAPQNLYIFHDRFRTLQRKANPLKKTLFSIITPQHQQIVDWLKTLPNVDAKRIAFYGLSYGGKTAMRVPALVPDYCLSICSADFNEWVWKNASTRSPYSYAFMGEYEIFEFDLGSTFNYAEMASLIAPRPFMVERGHHDGVAPDETIGYEFAKVRFLYEARLKLADRCAIEWFDGPHTIHGKGTFEFLHKHLNWP